MATNNSPCFDGKIIQNVLSRFVLGKLFDAISAAHQQVAANSLNYLWRAECIMTRFKRAVSKVTTRTQHVT